MTRTKRRANSARSYYARGTAYFDPKDFGDSAYWLLPCMLCVFERVQVHQLNPDAYVLARRRLEDQKLEHWMMPEWDEIESFIGRGLSISYFPTYLNEDFVRSRPDLLKATQLNPPLEDLRRQHAEEELARMEAQARDDEIVAGVRSKIQSGHHLPERYQKVVDEQVAFFGVDEKKPPASIWLPAAFSTRWGNLEPAAQVLLVARYDRRNDGLSAKSIPDKQKRPHLAQDGLFSVQLEHGEPFYEASSLKWGSLSDDEAAKILQTSIRMLSDRNGNIAEFRERYQDFFARALDKIVNAAQQEPHPEARIAKAKEVAGAIRAQIEFPSRLALGAVELLLLKLWAPKMVLWAGGAVVLGDLLAPQGGEGMIGALRSLSKRIHDPAVKRIARTRPGRTLGLAWATGIEEVEYRLGSSQ